MNKLSLDEQELLLQVLDGVILEAKTRWKAEEEGPRRELLGSLCSKLARLGLHIIDLLQPPTIH